MMPLPIRLVFVGLLVLVSACGNRLDAVSETKSFTVQQLYAGVQCGSQNPQLLATWITSNDDLRRVHRSFFAHVLGAEPPVQPSVDFGSHVVLLLEMGQRPTAGYSLALLEDQAQVKNGIAVIAVNWEQPAPDRYQAQVITSPCSMIKLQKAGYSRIRIVDQQQHMRIELPAP